MKTLWVGSIPGSGAPDRQVRLLGVGDGQIRAWNFAGESPEEQISNMRRLARYMQQGRERLNTEIFNLLEVEKENWNGTAEQFVDILFSSERFVFELEPVVDIAVGETILDVLEEAGAALLALLTAA